MVSVMVCSQGWSLVSGQGSWAVGGAVLVREGLSRSLTLAEELCRCLGEREQRVVVLMSAREHL